jgi:hypothetical protein
MVEGVEVDMTGGERPLEGGERTMRQGGTMWVDMVGYERVLN